MSADLDAPPGAFPLDAILTLADLPRRLTDEPAWQGHLPFARWLVRVARPRSIVELGVYKGDSYCTFCETVQETGLDARCAGIDTWQGDAHTGSYTEAVYQDLVAHHDPLYGGFSRLLRMTFEEARPGFADGSVDLLHIDGLHTYEAVREDFETWLPKVSSRGVVLFHDTVVRHGDFGVYRFWDEVTRHYPAFQFTHSNGLGVLAVGAEVPPALRWLTGLAPDQAERVRALFAGLGERLTDRREAAIAQGRLAEIEPYVRRVEAHAQDLTARLVAAGGDGAPARIVELEERLRAAEARAHDLTEQLETVAWEPRRHAALLQRIAASCAPPDAPRPDGPLPVEDAAAAIEAALHRAAEHQAALTRHVADLERALDQAGGYARDLEWKLQHAELRIAQVFASTSWRVTAPLRKLARLAGRGGGPPATLPRPIAAAVAVAAEAVSHAAAATAPAAEPLPDPEARLQAAKEAMRARVAAEFEAFMAGEERIVLPAAGLPKVSVVLVLWNQAALTLACLRSLARESAVPIEVVIVDNASTDRTRELLDRVDGARVLRNADNTGFLLAVNQGVAAATGEQVLLLNNDAIIREGGLAAAVEVLQGDETVGAVGARVILPDGQLQEAGSIVWNDGSCLGHLRGAAPDAAEGMFRRDVDYCSGVFLLFRRRHFEEMGGFDEAYVPAYYEEVDFCLRLWARGLRVVYDPRVVVDHLEFGSSVKSEQAIALQQRNRAALVERHRDALARQAAPGAANILRARMRDAGLGRVLIVDDRVPLPWLGSGYPRAERLVREVAATGRFVTFYPLQFPTETWRDTWATVPPEVEVAMGRGNAGLDAFLREREGYYDTLIVSRPHNMEALSRARARRPESFAGMRVIYDAEAIFALRDVVKARLLGDDAALREAEARVPAELALTAGADDIAAVSEGEAAHFRAATAARVHVLGHTLAVTPTAPAFPQRNGLLFVGPLDNDEAPNADSVKWFVQEVMPALARHDGAPTTLTCAGRAGAPGIEALRGAGLELLGRVEKLEAEYARHRVFVAPTRFAGGIPLKVYEAAAHGIPVVATGLLARQLGWTDGVELLVADDAEGFAAAVARLHADETLWQRIRDGALARVAEDCSPERFRATVRAMLGD